MLLSKFMISLGSSYRYVRSKNAANIKYFSLSSHHHSNPKTGILMLNMGAPQTTIEVGEYFRRIKKDSIMRFSLDYSILIPTLLDDGVARLQQKLAAIEGGSPILKWTQLQGDLLCKKLDEICPESAPHKPYVAFCFANPLTEKTMEDIERDGVKRVVIFSQHPQYSCATAGPSFNAIYSYFKNKNHFPKDIKWSVIDRWFTHPLLVKTFAVRIKEHLNSFPEDIRDQVVILFSAHSLPTNVIDEGDSYPSEVGATVHLVMKELNNSNPFALVWQSKIGFLDLLRPFTDEAIEFFVHNGENNFILVPIAFVNEHFETLYELDINYCKDLQKKVKCNMIRRVEAPNDHPIFIDALADIVSTHLKRDQQISPLFLMRCPHCTNEQCYLAKKWYSELCS